MTRKQMTPGMKACKDMYGKKSGRIGSPFTKSSPNKETTAQTDTVPEISHKGADKTLIKQAGAAVEKQDSTNTDMITQSINQGLEMHNIAMDTSDVGDWDQRQQAYAKNLQNKGSKA